MRMTGAVEKLVGLMNLMCGATVLAGSVNELVAAVVPGVLPALIRSTYASLHSPPYVHGWVILQNLCLLPISLGFIVSGWGLLRHRARARARGRASALAMIVVGLVNQLLLSFLLYPQLLDGTLAVDEPFPHFWLAMLVGTGFGFLIWPVIAFFVLRDDGSADASA